MADPTLVQTARLAIGQLREVWPYLVEARDAGLRRERPRHGTLTPAGRRELDELVRAERLDRLGLQRAGLVPQPVMPAPARLALVDADIHARQTLADMEWLTLSALRNTSADAHILDGLPPVVSGRDVTSVLDFLTVTVEHVDEVLTRHAAAALTVAACRLHGCLGYDPPWAQLGRRCPACGRRSLRQWTGSPHRVEWTVECTGDRPACRCTGPDCPCSRDDARKGSVHRWPVDAQQRPAAAA